MFERLGFRKDRDGLIRARTRAVALGRLAALTDTEPEHNFGRVATVSVSRNRGPERTAAQKEQFRAKAQEVQRVAFDVNAGLAKAEENIGKRRAARVVKEALRKDYALELTEATHTLKGPLIVREMVEAKDGHGMRCAHCNSRNEQPVFAAGTIIYTAVEATDDIRFIHPEDPDEPHVTTAEDPEGTIRTVELSTADLHFMNYHPDTDDAARANEALSGLYGFTQRGLAGL